MQQVLEASRHVLGAGQAPPARGSTYRLRRSWHGFLFVCYSVVHQFTQHTVALLSFCTVSTGMDRSWSWLQSWGIRIDGMRRCVLRVCD